MWNSEEQKYEAQKQTALIGDIACSTRPRQRYDMAVLGFQ